MTQPETNDATTTQKLKDSQARMADSARGAAHDAAETIKPKLASAADKTRQGAAHEIKGVADALQKAAADMDDGSPQRRMIDTAAKGLEGLSDSIHQKNMGELLDDLNSLARRNPLMFLGGAALLGFAATRLVSASAPENRQDSASHTSGSAATNYGAGGMQPAGATPVSTGHSTNPTKGV